MSKIVFITGASSGIGKSIGDYLLDKGFVVYGTSRTPEKYAASRFKLLPLDLKNADSINSCFADFFKIERQIDVLINNAGVGITGAVEEVTEEELKSHFDTNFFGPINVIKAVLPHMRDYHSGLIINVTSIAGFMGLPFRGVYSASKSALSIASEALRMEVKAFNVDVTTIAPGDFATDIASRRFHAPVKDNSPYKANYSQILEQINTDVDSAQSPIKVAEMVFKIISSKSPKVHYKVGSFLQKLSVGLKAILPDKTYEKLLRKHYKL